MIPSINSDYFLIGHSNGSFTIHGSNLMMAESKKYSMFDLDKKGKIKKTKSVIEKAHQRLQIFEDFKKQALRKST